MPCRTVAARNLEPGTWESATQACCEGGGAHSGGPANPGFQRPFSEWTAAVWGMETCRSRHYFLGDRECVPQ
jgi:hypothetical protein